MCEQRHAVVERVDAAVILELREIVPALARRIDQRLVDGMKGALRERRERPDVLDLVAEELDSQGFAPGAREHVDEPSPNCDLSTLLGPFDALVAGESQSFYQAVYAWLVAGSDTHEVGSRLRRRHSLGESPRRDADEAAVGEHGERTGALADEVCRRLEAGTEANAAARKQRDTRRIAVPGDRLGRVARLFVLGEQADERARERLVQGGEDERQRGLRDAGGRGKSSRNARKRSLEASSATRPERADLDGSMRLAGIASRGVIVALSLRLAAIPPTAGATRLRRGRRSPRQPPPGAPPCPL